MARQKCGKHLEGEAAIRVGRFEVGHMAAAEVATNQSAVSRRAFRRRKFKTAHVAVGEVTSEVMQGQPVGAGKSVSYFVYGRIIRIGKTSLLNILITSLKYCVSLKEATFQEAAQECRDMCSKRYCMLKHAVAHSCILS